MIGDQRRTKARNGFAKLAKYDPDEEEARAQEEELTRFWYGLQEAHVTPHDARREKAYRVPIRQSFLPLYFQLLTVKQELNFGKIKENPVVLVQYFSFICQSQES